ncbi:MAG: S-layer homology domain-containing protein, partial [Cyanobacteriota bacterium]
MVSSSPPFSDIQNHWARSFIEALAERGIVSGFPDGSFRPNISMTRAEF